MSRKESAKQSSFSFNPLDFNADGTKEIVPAPRDCLFWSKIPNQLAIPDVYIESTFLFVFLSYDLGRIGSQEYFFRALTISL